jgi:hypothetical protein
LKPCLGFPVETVIPGSPTQIIYIYKWEKDPENPDAPPNPPNQPDSLPFPWIDPETGLPSAFPPIITCFLAGTLIATPSGERPIETLKPGDLISTAEGPQPVRFISRTSHFPWVLEANDVLPIRIAAGALGERGPVRDLYVSPDHAILVDGHLLHASVLVNGTTITLTSLAHWQQRHNQPIEYLNIELERHQLITAEGLVVESFVDNVTRVNWDNYTAYLSLYHQELPIRELLLPRVKFKRQLSSALRRLLQQLADGGVQQRQLEAAG